MLMAAMTVSSSEFSRACPDINFVDGGFGCGKVPSLSEKSLKGTNK